MEDIVKTITSKRKIVNDEMEIKEHPVLSVQTDPRVEQVKKFILYLTDCIVPDLRVPFKVLVDNHFVWDEEGKWKSYFKNLYNRIPKSQGQLMHAAVKCLLMSDNMTQLKSLIEEKENLWHSYDLKVVLDVIMTAKEIEGSPDIKSFILYLTDCIVPDLRVPFKVLVDHHFVWDEEGKWKSYFKNLYNRIPKSQGQLMHAAVKCLLMSDNMTQLKSLIEEKENLWHSYDLKVVLDVIMVAYYEERKVDEGESKVSYSTNLVTNTPSPTNIEAMNSAEDSAAKSCIIAKRPRFTNREKPYIVLAGNPGVGKSTILNSLVGHAIFRSGVNFGDGLTKRVELFETPEYILGDTPGLSDVSTRQQAADEISELLRQVKSLTLFFVVTLESGRVKPDDLTTINLILDSIDIGDTTNQFTIVINKVPKKIYQTLQSDEDHFTKIRASLTLRHKTSRIILIPMNNKLEDADNIVAQLDKTIVRLLLHSQPVVVKNVRDIDLSHASDLNQMFREQIKQIFGAHPLALASMRDQYVELRSRDPLACIYC